MDIAQGYYTPTGLLICSLDIAGNLIVNKSSYDKMTKTIREMFPNKNSDAIINNFIDYWQSHIVGIKESKLKSHTTLWKYKKMWRKVGFII